MRRALLLLSLLACHHDKPAATPAAPIAPRTITVTTDVPLDVTVLGPDTAKQTVIIITGGPGLSHDYAEPLGKLASADLRVAFYDQRGTGKSGRPPTSADGMADPAKHTLALHVADLEAIRAALKVDKVALLGHSWGSLIAQHYAIAHPEHVASLVILNGIPSNVTAFGAGIEHADKREEELAAQGLVPKEPPTASGDGDCSAVKPLLPIYYADPKFPPGAEMAKMTCHKLSGATFATIGDAWDNRAALGKLTVHSLVMTGEGDLFGVGWADDMAAALPGAKKVVLPKCGHMMWDECPDALFGELRAFLTK